MQERLPRGRGVTNLGFVQVCLALGVFEILGRYEILRCWVYKNAKQSRYHLWITCCDTFDVHTNKNCES